jgi:LacI family transcriptional regulator
VIIAAGTTSQGQGRAIEALLDRRIDGLVLVETSWVEEIAKAIPVVAVALHGSPAGFDTVVDDDRLGAKLMVDHLVSLGLRLIVHTSLAPADLHGSFVLSHTARRQGLNWRCVDTNWSRKSSRRPIRRRADT